MICESGDKSQIANIKLLVTKKIVFESDIDGFIIYLAIWNGRLFGIMYYSVGISAKGFMDCPCIFHAPVEQGPHHMRITKVADDNLDLFAG